MPGPRPVPKPHTAMEKSFSTPPQEAAASRYDFDRRIERRGTGCVKYDGSAARFCAYMPGAIFDEVFSLCR